MSRRLRLRPGLALLLALAVVCACQRKTAPELVDLGPLPPFAMTDQDGRPVEDTNLRGTVWVANFMFTSCPTSCPPLAKATAALQERLKARLPKEGPPPIRLLTVSVDPLTDTPEVLKAFAAKYGADPRIWTLLTGDYETMERLVVQGFMQPIIRADRITGTPSEHTATQAPTPLDTAHSLRFVLIDRQLHIRGLFDRDEAGLQALQEAAHYLADQPR